MPKSYYTSTTGTRSSGNTRSSGRSHRSRDWGQYWDDDHIRGVELNNRVTNIDLFFHAFFKLFLFPRWGDPPPSRRGHRKKRQRVVVVRGRWEITFGLERSGIHRAEISTGVGIGYEPGTQTSRNRFSDGGGVGFSFTSTSFRTVLKLLACLCCFVMSFLFVDL